MSLSKKFIKGLELRGLDYDDVVNNWKYCGGDSGSHNNYFMLCYSSEKRPANEDRCVCEHPIQENCYITNGELFLVVGNCCIKKFMVKSGRTCEECGSPHKNRNVNLCNLHRKWTCSDCGRGCGYKQYKCIDCNPYLNKRY
jgi:hypothetical protein